jgi:hypothetical protein
LASTAQHEHFAILASAPPSDNFQYDVGLSSEFLSPVTGTWYQVLHPGGIQLLSAPCSTAPFTGVSLGYNETFQVSEELPSCDGLMYLRLADGRGWAFDTSALKSQWPCVLRGRWLMCSISGTMSWVPDSTQTRQRRHPQPRGKRGGKRVSKRRNTAQTGTANNA